MATEEEMIERLLVTLKRIGFEKAEVEDKVKEVIWLNFPCSWLRLRKDYGTETMFIELQLNINRAKGSLSVDKYTAVYRRPVYTDVKMENGVDIAALEARMQRIDWGVYYRWKTAEVLPGDLVTAAYTEETIALLHQLALTEKGARVCELLQYKYFPDELSGMPGSHALKNRFETSREFPVDGKTLCPVNTAYHLLSGRLHDLQEAIESLMGEWKPNSNLRAILEDQLAADPVSFELKFDFQFPNGLAQIVIPVFKSESYYGLDVYSMTVTRYPKVPHGTYNGVETWDLEQTMQRVDWQHGKVIPPVPADKEAALFRDWSTEALEDLARLWKSDEGLQIAGILVHRYLQGNAVLMSKVPGKVLNITGKFDKVSLDFGAEVKLAVAYNLMEGRCVPRKLVQPWVEGDSNKWLKLKSGVSSICETSFIEIEGPTPKEVYTQLQQLPFGNSMELGKACVALCRGDMTKAVLGNGVEVLLQMTGDKMDVGVYSLDLLPIPVNFGFDPYWKPGNSMEPLTQEEGRQVDKHKPGDHHAKNGQDKKSSPGKGL